MSKLIYISKSNRNRKDCVEKALTVAKGSNQDLTFVATLDKERFADLPESMVTLAAEELKGLLKTQLQGSAKHLDAGDVKFEVVVRTGISEDDAETYGDEDNSETLKIS